MKTRVLPPSALGALVLTLTLAAGPAGAVSPKYFIHDTAEEWIRGEPSGVSITSDGTLRLAPRVDVLATPEVPYLWDLAVDSERGIAYVNELRAMIRHNALIIDELRQRGATDGNS